jgi:hypothetical protein
MASVAAATASPNHGSIHTFRSLREERREPAAMLAELRALAQRIEEGRAAIADLGGRNIEELTRRASAAEAALTAANTTIASQSDKIAELAAQADRIRLVASGGAGVVAGLAFGCAAGASPEKFLLYTGVGALAGVAGNKLYDYYMKEESPSC